MQRDPLRWQTHLGQWVTALTVPGLVSQLRHTGYSVTESAVYNWVAGAHVPQPGAMLRIVELSGGSIGPLDFYRQPSEIRELARCSTSDGLVPETR